MEKNLIIEKLNNAKYVNIEEQKYFIGQPRNCYFNTIDNIYDEFSKNIDDLEFMEDKVSIIRNNHSYNISETLLTMFEVIDNYDINDIEGLDNLTEEQREFIEEMTLTEIETEFNDIYNNTVEILDSLTDEDLDIHDNGNIIFDCDYIEEAIDNGTYEALAYWTVYFEPNYEDIEIAQKVGLTPFRYKDTFYLALGGCGMDLSPKLDAYISLTCRQIPSDSRFFDDRNYFEYVAGKSITEEIEKECKRDNVKYIISFEE